MLRPRLIPCLLIRNAGLVKTVGFSAGKYVGDPINAVRIFNEKEVDELLVMDIDASRLQREPDYQRIGHLAAECRMPLAYGGGVKTVAQAERLIGLGVEKVAISSAAVDDPELITRVARRLGSQSVVVVVDVKRPPGCGREVVTLNGTRFTGLEPIKWSRQAEDLGAGEIVLNSVDRDGLMTGYDLELIDRVRRTVNIPLTALGGAGSLGDIRVLLERCGVVGAAAGSLFVFKGKFRAVLLNYPSHGERDDLAKALRQDRPSPSVYSTNTVHTR